MSIINKAPNEILFSPAEIRRAPMVFKSAAGSGSPATAGNNSKEVRVKVGEAMTKKCKLVHANDTVRKAAQLMEKEEIGWLPVQDGDRLIGMITDRDIVTRCVAQGKESSAHVRDAMTHDVKYCFEDEELEHTLDNMAELQLRRIPVMSRNKRLVGTLTLADAARSHDPAAVGAAFCAVVEPGGHHAGSPMHRH